MCFPLVVFYDKFTVLPNLELIGTGSKTGPINPPKCKSHWKREPVMACLLSSFPPFWPETEGIGGGGGKGGVRL